MSVQREWVDLSNVNMIAGSTGRFATVNVVPVVAGDSVEGSFSGVVRLSPSRRNVVLDAQVDIVTFFVPHRHIYPTWSEFIAAGADGGVVLPSVTYADIGKELIGSDGNPSGIFEAPSWVPWIERYAGAADTVPLWLVQPMINFWNRYGRLPKVGLAEAAFTDASFGADYNLGFPGARMPHIWSRLHESTSTDEDVPSAAVVKLSDITKQAALFKRDQQGEWAVEYPDDILGVRFGGSEGRDADVRPTLVAHTTSKISGFNIYGTAESTLESVTGRYEGFLQHGWKRRYFGEHGTLMTCMVVRYPEVAASERHYLSGRASPSYKEFACDPLVLETELPIGVDASDFFLGAPAPQFAGFTPYGEWMRSNPNVVSHPWIGDNPSSGIGYPLRPGFPSNLVTASMQSVPVGIGGGNAFDTDDVFYQTTELLQFNVSARSNVRALRCCPGSWKSIYSAADLT